MRYIIPLLLFCAALTAQDSETVVTTSTTTVTTVTTTSIVTTSSTAPHSQIPPSKQPKVSKPRVSKDESDEEETVDDGSGLILMGYGRVGSGRRVAFSRISVRPSSEYVDGGVAGGWSWTKPYTTGEIDYDFRLTGIAGIETDIYAEDSGVAQPYAAIIAEAYTDIEDIDNVLLGRFQARGGHSQERGWLFDADVWVGPFHGGFSRQDEAKQFSYGVGTSIDLAHEPGEFVFNLGFDRTITYVKVRQGETERRLGNRLRANGAYPIIPHLQGTWDVTYSRNAWYHDDVHRLHVWTGGIGLRASW